MAKNNSKNTVSISGSNSAVAEPTEETKPEVKSIDTLRAERDAIHTRMAAIKAEYDAKLASVQIEYDGVKNQLEEAFAGLRKELGLDTKPVSNAGAGSKNREVAQGRRDKIVSFLTDNPNKTVKQIESATGLNRMEVFSSLQALKKLGKATVAKRGEWIACEPVKTPDAITA